MCTTGKAEPYLRRHNDNLTAILLSFLAQRLQQGPLCRITSGTAFEHFPCRSLTALELVALPMSLRGATRAPHAGGVTTAVNCATACAGCHLAAH